MSNLAIKVEGISKVYRIGLKEKEHESLAGTLIEFLKSPFKSFSTLKRLGTAHKDVDSEDTISALTDISFDVNHGDVIGIIGRNGAGKSTLLKIISRITEPSSGKIVINGRVASLLEVGTGFHPDLTGRENVFLNGAILGMTKREIQRKFDEILAFSGVEKFIDTPVKRYSSGMKVRIAFSVAAHLDPEILLIDEVLAVGDAAFQKMCLAKMDDVAKGGRTILFVSHQIGMVRSLCNKGVLLKNGKVEYKGDITSVINTYEQSLESKFGNDAFVEFPERKNVEGQILSAELQNEAGDGQIEFDVFEQVYIRIVYKMNEPVESVAMGIVVERNGETLFFSTESDSHPDRLLARKPGIYTTRVKLPSPLKAGRFLVHLEMGPINGKFKNEKMHLERDALCFDVVEKSFSASLMSYSAQRVGVLVTHLEWPILDFTPKEVLEKKI